MRYIIVFEKAEIMDQQNMTTPRAIEKFLNCFLLSIENKSNTVFVIRVRNNFMRAEF